MVLQSAGQSRALHQGRQERHQMDAGSPLFALHHAASSATMPFGSSFTPWLTIWPTSCGRWLCRPRWNTGRRRRCVRSWSRSGPRLSAMAGTSRSNWPKSPCPGTRFGKSRGGSMNCDEHPFRRRPGKSTVSKRCERCVRMTENMGKMPSGRRKIAKTSPSDSCGRDAVPLAVGRWYDFPEPSGYLGNVGLTFDDPKAISLRAIMKK